MALSNTATPIYYGQFRDAVMRGEIPVNKEISMEMNRIDDLILLNYGPSRYLVGTISLNEAFTFHLLMDAEGTMSESRLRKGLLISSI